VAKSLQFARHTRAKGSYGPAMTEARQILGREGERIVARELERRGWRVVARNARVKGVRGELDVIAIDGDTLVVVEVKTGRACARSGPVSMLEMVGPKKQRKLRVLAAAWLRANRTELPRIGGLRIDVIGLRLDPAGRVTSWDYVKAAC
jgi:putative endonuclease